MILLILIHALFASCFTFNKAILKISSPIFFVGIKSLLSGLILCAYSFKKKEFKNLNLRILIPLLKIGIAVTFSRAILKNLALKNMPSIKTAFFYNLSPFITAFFAYVFFKEKISKSKMLGMLIAFFGVYIYLSTHSPLENLIPSMRIISWEEIYILSSIAIGILGWLQIQHLVKNKEYPSSLVLGISMLFGGVLSLIASFFIEATPRVTNIRLFSAYLTYIVLVSGVIGYSIYAHLHKKYSATLISLAGFTEPLFIAIYGILFLNETLSWSYLAGTIFICLGIYSFYKEN